MRINTYTSPKSSFLSLEKDMELISSYILKNDRLKRLLYYADKEALTNLKKCPNLSQEQSAELFRKNIKLVPKIGVNPEALNYIVISFDNFTPNFTNPEFRNNVVEFDILCHYDYWQLNDFALRPYKIAAELDSMLNEKRLTGIGLLNFSSAQFTESQDKNYGGICLRYSAIHGEEDKTRMPNPNDEKRFLEDFNKMIKG